MMAISANIILDALSSVVYLPLLDGTRFQVLYVYAEARAVLRRISEFERKRFRLFVEVFYLRRV